MDFRIGQGYDVHRLAEGEELFIGGVKFESEKGAVGHSDADVLLHAICDAILGALSLRDIGYHFPNTDEAYKGIDSKKLLQKVMELISEKGWVVNNVDATVVLEQPKVNPKIDEIKETIAPLLQVIPDAVSIKATTSEKVGFVGREEGVEAHAVVLLKKE